MAKGGPIKNWNPIPERSLPKSQKKAWINTGPNSSGSRRAKVVIFDKRGKNGLYGVKWSKGRGQGGSLGKFSNFKDARKRAASWMRKHANI